MRFSPKMFDPFKIQIEFTSWGFNSTAGNLNFFPNKKLFHVDLSSSLQSLEFFGGEKGLILYFSN
jgi:hypothetical protein